MTTPIHAAAAASSMASDQSAHGGYVQVTIALNGALDPERLHSACAKVSARYDVWRQLGMHWSACELSTLPADAQCRAARQTAQASGRAVERRSAATVATLVRRSATCHELVLTSTPLVADAASLERYCRDLLNAYDDGPVEPTLAYADVVNWQAQLLHDEDAEQAQRYWARYGSPDAAAELLPFEREIVPAAEVSEASASLAFTIPPTLASLPSSAEAFWLTCWQALFFRLSGGARLATGVVAHARRFEELRDVVGPLDRTLPVPTVLRFDDTFARASAALAAVLRDHLAWQEYYGSAPPSWRVGFGYHAWPRAVTARSLSARLMRPVVETTGAPIALVVHATDDGGGQLRIHYDARRFGRHDVRQLGERLLRLAGEAAARPAGTIGAMSVLADHERERIVATWNATRHEYGRRPVVLQAALDAQAAATPDATAVWSEDDDAWTYAALHARANQIARRLLRLGAGAETRVGVWVPRSSTLVAALVGVVKAGAAYVPLDPSYPAARLAYQLSDAQVSVVLTTSACAESIPEGPYRIEVLDAPSANWREELETPPPVAVHPDQLAYVIYTSGSTGRPKGAMNTVRGIGNRLAWMQETFGIGPGDRVLQKTSCSFDVSVWEFFWPLLTGAAIVVARPGGQHDPAYLGALIARTRVSVVHFVPTMLEMFVAAGTLRDCDSVRLIVSSGEALPGSLAARCLSAWPGRLENLYGPTEAAVDVTWHSCGGADDRGSVPIGRPIANTQVYVRDAAGDPCPVGIVGELYLGGIQVGRGYWNRPDRTAECFVPDPFGTEPGARLYKTGDLARYRDDGVVEYIGRADHQVKLHGNRIELGEIEALLRQQADVRDAVVLVREDDPGVKRLVAYVVPSSPAETVGIESMQQRLRTHVPDYMVPAVIVPLPAFPVTPNGKVDRRALPAPGGERPALTAAYAAPRTSAEAALVQIWSEVLRVDRVGVDDNFFALGGDSIMSLQVVARATQAGWRLTPRDVFEHPTIAALAPVARVGTASAVADQSPLVGPVSLTPIQRWFFNRPLPRPQHYNQAVRVELPEQVLPVLDEAWLALQRHHDALRFRYRRTSDGWLQVGTAEETAARTGLVDLQGVATDARAQLDARIAAAVQRSLDLESGPVGRAVVVLAAGRPPQALLVLHHLVVDGVSWRVLLTDFEVATRQLLAGQPVVLPPKTSSMRDWVDALQGDRDALAGERSFWSEMTAPAAMLPRETAGAVNTIRTSWTQEVAFSHEDTRALLHDIPGRGAAHLPEVIVGAAVQALAAWTGDDTWRVSLEGHGRDALRADIDVSRTVGWFTSLYPVRVTAHRVPAATLRAAKSVMRRVPRNGIGYGVVRYAGDLGAAADAGDAEILINYLGQLDQAIASAAALRPVAGPTGWMRDPAAPREYLLEINAIVAGGQLRVAWTSSPHFDAETIAHLVERFTLCVRDLVAAALDGVVDDELVAADLRDAHLDDAELNRIAELLDAAELA